MSRTVFLTSPCCRYRRLVDSIYPRAITDGLISSNMQKLIFYAISHPEKLERIGEYLVLRMSRDLGRMRYVQVKVGALISSTYLIFEFFAVFFKDLCIYSSQKGAQLGERNKQIGRPLRQRDSREMCRLAQGIVFVK